MSLISWIRDRLFYDLAIDIGTTNTLNYLKGKGIIVQESSMVVINKQTCKVEYDKRRNSHFNPSINPTAFWPLSENKVRWK